MVWRLKKKNRSINQHEILEDHEHAENDGDSPLASWPVGSKVGYVFLWPAFLDYYNTNCSRLNIRKKGSYDCTHFLML